MMMSYSGLVRGGWGAWGMSRGVLLLFPPWAKNLWWKRCGPRRVLSKRERGHRNGKKMRLDYRKNFNKTGQGRNFVESSARESVVSVSLKREK